LSIIRLPTSALSSRVLLSNVGQLKQPIGLKSEKIMPTISVFVLCACLGLVVGCTNEGVYGNIYEGLTIREAIVHPSAE
jgi:hypothetical protein